MDLSFYNKPNTTVPLMILTLVFSLIAYLFIGIFSLKMSKFEFRAEDDYQDKYLARHSLIISGVNPNIGTEEAA